jgi:hypothetical protein
MSINLIEYIYFDIELLKSLKPDVESKLSNDKILILINKDKIKRLVVKGSDCLTEEESKQVNSPIFKSLLAMMGIK